MASSIKSAGKAAPATSGASANRRPRQRSAQTDVPTCLWHHCHAFERVDPVEGHRRGMVAAFALLRQARESAPKGEPIPQYAHIMLRNFIAEAGVALLARDFERKGGRNAARMWAAVEALRPFVDMVLWAMPHFDLEEWERQAAQRLEQEDAWILRRQAEQLCHQSEQREAFVQRMRQGREQAQARRAQGGAA